MDSNTAGMAGLNEPPEFDRFASWPRGLARLAAAVLVLLIALAAWAPGYAPPPPAPPKVIVTDAAGRTHAVKEDDNDLRLYRLIIARVKRGDDYYVAATEEQRRNGYPVAPGLTVRLPTLAFVSAWVGPMGLIALQIALFIAMLLAVARRLGAEPGGERHRLLGLTLLFVGISSALNAHYNVLHEIWAAQLIALSFGLHRPALEPGQSDKWLGAWLAAAAALAVRELALPFVLLMAASAGWNRRWRECAAWAALIALFGAGLMLHLELATAQIRPGDPVSPAWLVLSGLPGFLYKVINSTALSLLPVWLGGPVVVLCLFGWSGWKTPMGTLATLLLLGYAAAYMIAGRDNNFYWGVVITPVLCMGLAFVPLALPSLVRRAFGAPGA